MTHVLGAFGGPTTPALSRLTHRYPSTPRNTHTRLWTASAATTTPGRRPGAVGDRRARADVVILTTPNNLTGTPTPLAVIERVLAGTDAIVVVDEAYQESPPGTPNRPR
ncbi:MAG: aminotransferase class I/II-fold pyridoxal phosphate-dependent enzyme [Micropruina sp.]